jgi:hypothetical protein
MRPKTYGRRARRKDRLLRGFCVWPMEPSKALQTFSSSAQKVRALVKLKTGQEPEAFNWRVLPCEISLRVYEKRPLLTTDHKIKDQ